MELKKITIQSAVDTKLDGMAEHVKAAGAEAFAVFLKHGLTDREAGKLLMQLQHMTWRRHELIPESTPLTDQYETT